ncbi:hypothetical protein A3H85_03245 [Candidatus Daviesbacteria bacterium RIFCSPLOWO2_02_FULL_40_8]|nr:MAG: hypothetical protein A3H85_03245 [Candidatus Daviesbacteria bacterium RIFCSPLOWO2_02_FULL_40_8]
MLILPIESISEVDQALFGANIYNLSQLKRSGLPVPDGIALTPPEFILKTVLEHTRDHQIELFEQRLTLLRETLLNTPIPTELLSILKTHKKFWCQSSLYDDPKQLWESLIDRWLAQLRAKIWRDGFSTPIEEAFSPYLIFFADKTWVKTDVTAFIDPDSSEVLLKTTQKLTVPTIQQIQDAVRLGDKKLYLPHFYQFTINNKPILIGISPYTNHIEGNDVEIEIPLKQENKLIRSATKLFVNATSGITLADSHVDGVLVETERFNDPHEAIIKVGEMAILNIHLPIILRLPDFKNGDIQGSLRLINQQSLLDTSSSTYLFLRNKKRLLNISLGIPTVRSVEEYKELKNQLAKRGINRGPTLKYWLEFNVPENIIRVDDYLKIGLDGIILDLDMIQTHLCGINTQEGEFYKHNIGVVMDFLQPFCTSINNQSLPLIAKGQLALYPQILDFLILQGVYGVVVNTLVESFGLGEHLVESEQRSIIRKLTDLSLN